MKKNLNTIDDYVEILKIQGDKNVIDTLIERGLSSKIKFAIRYRSVNISYGYMINQILAYARSLQSLGILEREKVLISPIDTPEFIYALLAIIYIGAEPVTIKEDTDVDLIKKLFDETQAKTLLAPATLLNSLTGTLRKINSVELPYDKSLPEGRNPYAKVEYEFLSEKEREKYQKKVSDKTEVMTIDEFVAKGQDRMLEKSKTRSIQKIYTLEDDFQEEVKSQTIFSHDVRSFIMRAKEFENGLANTDRPVNVLSTIPLNTYEGLVKVMNTLLCGKTLCLEPIHDPKFMASSILIIKPNIFYAPHDALIKGFTIQYTDERYKNARISPFIKIVSYGGILSDNEKRFIRKVCSNPFLSIISELETSDGALLYSKKSTYYPVYEAMPFVKLGIKDRPMDEIENYNADSITAYSALDAVNTHYPVFKNTGWYGLKDPDGDLRIDSKEYEKDTNGWIRDMILEELQRVKGVVTVKVVTLENGYNVAHVVVDDNMGNLDEKSVTEYIYNQISKCLSESVKEKLLFRIRNLDEPMPLTSDGIIDDAALIKDDMCKTYGAFIVIDSIIVCQGRDYIVRIRNREDFKKLRLHPVDQPKDRH